MGDPLGIVSDLRGSTLTVMSASSGAVAKHNQSADTSMQVQPNDFILQVNDKTDPDDASKELEQKGSLKLKVQRAVPFNVSVSKAGGKSLGMKLAFVAASTSISIVDIVDGAVADYNKHAPAAAQIKAKDRIVGVSGVYGTADKMAAALQAAETLEFKIARVAP